MTIEIKYSENRLPKLAANTLATLSATLLVAATMLSAGCNQGHDENSGKEGSGTSTSTSMGTDANTSTGAGGEGVTSSSSSDEPLTTDAMAGSTGGSQPSSCELYCAKEIECDPSKAEGCQESCQYESNVYSALGASCLDSWTGFVACVSGSTCEALQADACAMDPTQCILPECSPLCARELECDDIPGESAEDKLGCEALCSFEFGEAVVDAIGTSEACAKAFKELLACQAMLTCEQYNQDGGCEGESLAVNTACGG